jgi:hypothetical protein
VQNGTGDVQFTMNDLNGRCVWSKIEQNANSGGIQIVDVSALPPGIYLISVITETGKTVSKIAIN